MECKHVINEAAVRVAEGSRRPERARVQCVLCGKLFTIEEAKQLLEKAEECQTTEISESDIKEI